MEDWVTIRNLKKKNPYMGTRKIADLVGIFRSTVKKALASDMYPSYHREPAVSVLIDPFVEYIKESYLVRKQKVSVIIENLKSKGFTGSPISIYRYIAKHLKPQRDMGYQKSYEPYSTLPGEQMFYDWAEYIMTIGGKKVKVYIHLTELGFCRYKVLDVTLTIKMGDVFEVLENAFLIMGGLTQRIQVDNARIFVTDPSVVNFKWNEQFLQFCGFYGIHPTRSLPGHPWSKGKVERPFQYIEDHFITNNSFDSFEDLYQKLKVFEKEINDKVHSITHKKPSELLAEEKPHFLEMPENRYAGHRGELRKATKDCLIAFGGNRYSVPYLYAGQDVWVRISKGLYVTVQSNTGKIIATHALLSDKGQVIINKEHYRGHIQKSDRESFFISAEKMKERFASYENIDKFLEAAKSQRAVNANYNIFMISRLFDDYSDIDCQSCMEECLQYRCFTFAFVKGYIAHRAQMNIPVLSPSRPLHEIGLFYKANVKRSMEEYRI